jgi:exodeoxyribonuclease VII large subunit
MFDERPNKDKPLSVSQLTAQVKDLLEGSLLLRNIWVQGEVSNFREYASGHWYFTVKDAGSALKCVMWRSAAAGQPVRPRDGAALLVRGKITVYDKSGEYQLQADQVRPAGVGDLYAQLEEVKARLVAEGLTDSARKRPLPPLPWRIGVVTSPDAAAFQDVLNVLRRRFPLGEVILSPTPVQGTDAPAHIVRALQRLNAPDVCDVILVCRGGGSIEDLWAFNHEGVARAVADSVVPVVTGVGHETDTTLVDFVSDLRAPTPSAAAEAATQFAVDLPAYVDGARRDLDQFIGQRLDDLRDAVQRTDLRMQVRSPERVVQSMRQTVDRLTDRLLTRAEARLVALRGRLDSEGRALEAANPTALLARGYALVRRAHDGAVVRSAGQVGIGDEVTVQVQDGRFSARVVEEGKLL